MDTRKEDYEVICSSEECCPDVEDALVDFSRMSPEEMGRYLEVLSRTRSLGCLDQEEP